MYTALTGSRKRLPSQVRGRLRELALSKAGHRCQFCGETDPKRLIVHHIADLWMYPNVGDVVVMCRDCHAKWHGKAARGTYVSMPKLR